MAENTLWYYRTVTIATNYAVSHKVCKVSKCYILCFKTNTGKKRKAKYVAKKGPSFVSGPLKIRRFCSGWLTGESGESCAMQREPVWKKGRQSYTMQTPDLTCTVPHQPKKLVF